MTKLSIIMLVFIKHHYIFFIESILLRDKCVINHKLLIVSYIKKLEER